MQHSFQSWNSNFLVFLDNLSVYYILSLIIAILIIVLSYCLVPTDKLLFQNFDPEDNYKLKSNTTDKILEEDQEHTIISNIKKVQHKTIVNTIKHSLTKEELEQEKKIESEQLEEIFKLMKNQQEKFNLNSKQEIQEQLKLYGL